MRGYSLALSKSVAIDMGSGDRVLFTFMGHAERTERDAIVLTYEVAGGVEKVALETVSGNPVDAASTTQLAGVLRIDALSAGGPGVISLGKVDYFKCVAFCVGANCSSKAQKCVKLRFMYLVLACMVAVCGSKVKTCHKVCKKKW